MFMCVQKLNVSPAYLRNDGNKYLNYTDDWYVLAQKPDEYVVIYYRGNNDAWKGYGGATIYTRCALTSSEEVCSLISAVKLLKEGRKSKSFRATSCVKYNCCQGSRL